MNVRFVDVRGTEWEVWEVGARPVVADRPPRSSRRKGDGGAWLCFESATQRRRLDRYPAHWHAMSSRDLRALCDAATPTQPTVVSSTPWFVDVELE